MAQTVTRVAGGGNTFVTLGNGTKRIRLLASCNDRPGTVNGGPTPIQGVGDIYPFEIATGYSQGAGTLTLEVYQVWGKDGWVSMWDDSINALKDPTSNRANFLQGFQSNMNRHVRTSPADVVEMLRAQREFPGFVGVAKVECGRDGRPVRVKKYMGCVITDISAGENIQNNSMDMRVTITMMYTHAVIVNAQNTAVASLTGAYGKSVNDSLDNWDSGNV